MERTDIFDALALQHSLLKKTSCWPKRRKSLFYLSRQIFFWIIDLVFLLTMIMEFNLNINERDYQHLTELISLMSSEISYIIKHAIFVLNAKRFLVVMDNLQSPIFKEYPFECDRHVKNTIKYAKLIMRIYITILSLCVLMYFLKPFFTKGKLAIRFEVYPLGHWWFALHCFQVLSIAIACWNNGCLDLTALGLTSIGAAQFQILRDKLLNTRRWAGLSYEEIENGEYCNIDEMREDIDRQVNESLKECAQHHIAIIQYCTSIEDTFCYYFLVQFVDSVFAICNTWYQFEMESNPVMVGFLILYSTVLMTQLGIYCFYGNNLTVQSEEIRHACYMSEWYNCGNSVRKSLMIIMERSKRPTVLTAGKISALGLTAYVTILRSAYSYYTVMNRMK